jgi:hypothetical protein
MLHEPLVFRHLFAQNYFLIVRYISLCFLHFTIVYIQGEIEMHHNM